MKGLTFALLLALALPAAAAAKGPDQVSISGPGLSKTITLRGDGETTLTALGQFAQISGFFPQAFEESPDPTLKHSPTASLGPQYRIHYRVPGGNNDIFRLDADLYPYASGGALTYMKPGQRVFDGKAYGGWYRAGTQLTILLKHHGLPAQPAPSTGASGSNPALVAGIAVPGALALVAAGLLYRRRSRLA
jgi:LPXTG-motif cell wall-anchored protein